MCELWPVLPHRRLTSSPKRHTEHNKGRDTMPGLSRCPTHRQALSIWGKECPRLNLNFATHQFRQQSIPEFRQKSVFLVVEEHQMRLVRLQDT